MIDARIGRPVLECLTAATPFFIMFAGKVSEGCSIRPRIWLVRIDGEYFFDLFFCFVVRLGCNVLLNQNQMGANVVGIYFKDSVERFRCEFLVAGAERFCQPQMRSRIGVIKLDCVSKMIGG